MKSIGITRRLDDLGRITLPVEVRRKFDLNWHDAVEIYIDDDRVVLKKFNPCCVFCDEAGDVISFRGKRICAKCLALLTKNE